MDPKGPPGMMFAPGASRGASTIKQPPASGPAPTQEPHPRWTDHVVKEDDRWELVDGQRIEVMGAERPHGSAQVRITTLMNLFQVPESDAASDLLIRCDVSSDFAPDAALMR